LRPARLILRTMTLHDGIGLAATLGVDGLECIPVLSWTGPNSWAATREDLARHGLNMSMLCCSRDFIEPDPERLLRASVEFLRTKIDLHFTHLPAVRNAGA
jgi:sugar phosphate isomerase/epimerase